jgi:hypothetical protein
MPLKRTPKTYNGDAEQFAEARVEMAVEKALAERPTGMRRRRVTTEG